MSCRSRGWIILIATLFIQPLSANFYILFPFCLYVVRTYCCIFTVCRALHIFCKFFNIFLCVYFVYHCVLVCCVFCIYCLQCLVLLQTAWKLAWNISSIKFGIHDKTNIHVSILLDSYKEQNLIHSFTKYKYKHTVQW